jgi:hypothetical protein
MNERFEYYSVIPLVQHKPDRYVSRHPMKPIPVGNINLRVDASPTPAAEGTFRLVAGTAGILGLYCKHSTFVFAPRVEAPFPHIAN